MDVRDDDGKARPPVEATAEGREAASRAPLGPSADRAWRWLTAEIESGRLPVGRRLPSETDLAQRLMVSRPVIRDALHRLRLDGLIFSRRGSGSYVAAAPARPAQASGPSFAPVESIADVQRCYEFRLTIETEAAAWAALRHDEARLRAIQAALDELRVATAVHEHREDADFRFHIAIATASNNHYYASAMQALKAHIGVGMKFHGQTLMGPGRHLEHVYEEHAGIFKAIGARDADLAGRLMALHLEGSRDRIFGGRMLDLSF